MRMRAGFGPRCVKRGRGSADVAFWLVQPTLAASDMHRASCRESHFVCSLKPSNTPVKRLYFCIQMMYLENDIPKYQDLYMGFIKDLLEAVPSFRTSIETAS